MFVVVSAFTPTLLGSLTDTPQRAQGLLFGIGTLVTLLAFPLAVPGMTWLVARRLAASRRPALWVAARRLRVDAVHLSRIASVVGLLIVTASVATSTDVPQNSGVLEPGREGRSLATCAGTLEG